MVLRSPQLNHFDIAFAVSPQHKLSGSALAFLDVEPRRYKHKPIVVARSPVGRARYDKITPWNVRLLSGSERGRDLDIVRIVSAIERLVLHDQFRVAGRAQPRGSLLERVGKMRPVVLKEVPACGE